MEFWQGSRDAAGFLVRFDAVSRDVVLSIHVDVLIRMIPFSQGGEMTKETVWKITVEDKDGNQTVIERTLFGESPPDNELAAVLIQEQLLGNRLLPSVSRDCREPTVYRLRVGGYEIKSVTRSVG